MAGTRMEVTQEGKRVFTGVVDECLCQWDEQGCTAEISGRGMQALLLDNQAAAADFGQAICVPLWHRIRKTGAAAVGLGLFRPLGEQLLEGAL